MTGVHRRHWRSARNSAVALEWDQDQVKRGCDMRRQDCLVAPASPGAAPLPSVVEHLVVAFQVRDDTEPRSVREPEHHPYHRGERSRERDE
jgi:hypothetical protein